MPAQQEGDWLPLTFPGSIGDEVLFRWIDCDLCLLMKSHTFEIA
jgi:hypothetical protein